MKLQLDTTNKTIKLDESVNLKNLIELLEQILPKEKWKEFKLETNTEIDTWQNPIVIQPYNQPLSYPWYSDSNKIERSVYCIEC